MENLGSLVTLSINDLKSIDVAEIDLSEKGKMVTLKGDNGVGKSTVMEAIETLFNGGKLPDGLIRNGKKEALIEGLFSQGYKARRRIRKTAKGKQVATLEVSAPDGKPVASPQSVLRELFSGYMSPTKLATMSGASLYKEVIAQFPVNLEREESQIEQIKEEEKLCNAELRVIGKMEKPAGSIEPPVEFNENEYFETRELLISLENKKAKIDDAEKELEYLQTEIEKMKTRMESLKEFTEDKQNIDAEIHSISGKLFEMDKTRTRAKEQQVTADEWKRYQEWESKHLALTKSLEGIISEKKQAIENYRTLLAETKAPGDITVDENRNVLIGGIPWENASFSERLKAAAMLQLKTMPEGKLPFMFIEHGESMNTEKRMEIARLAAEEGATVFVEIVNETIDSLIIGSEIIVSKDWEEKSPVIDKPKESAQLEKPEPLPQVKVPTFIPPEKKGPTKLPTNIPSPSFYPDDSELDIF